MAEVSPSVKARCVAIDGTLGPYAGDCRGGLDFTLLFEEAVLILLPITLFTVLVSIRALYLLKRTPKTNGKCDRFVVAKLSAWITLAALQLVGLVLWTNPAATRTHASIAAAALSPISTLAFGLLSFLEHSRTVRPSSPLTIFLVLTLLFDIVHTRTLWMRRGGGVDRTLAHLSAAKVVVKGTVLALEASRKTKWLNSTVRAKNPPEATSGILDRSFFWWLNPLFLYGYRHTLDVDHLFHLDKHLTSSYWYPRFRLAWDKASSSPSPYTLNLLSLRLLFRSLLTTLLPRLALSALLLTQPFLVHRTITLASEPITPHTTQQGYGLLGAYFFVYVGIAVAMGQYQHRTYRTITMARAGLVALIYNKAGSLSLRDADPAGAMTLMSADMERIVQGWQTMHEIWANTMEVAVAVYLLETQLGVACVVPVAVSVASLLGSMVAMNFIMSRQAMWLEAIERRISATSTMLSSMKGIKISGLRDTLLASMQNLRVEELSISKKYRRLIIWNMIFAYLTQIFAPVLTFLVFSLRARNSGDNTLDTARVFTALSLFVLLAEPLASLVMALASFVGAAGSFTRIQEFLASDERVDTRSCLPTIRERKGGVVEGDAITLHHATFTWNPSKKNQLRDLTLSIPLGRLTMIVGPVGCGKTTLLQAFLGEIAPLSGTVTVSSTGAAYCSQSAWHSNGTIRQAIVGEAGVYDEKWFDRVVNACALRRDLEELPGGEEAMVGSAGGGVSGGQGGRVALARAIYARRDICILDDVFSGLDASTESHVFRDLLDKGGLLREMGTTVVLVSSSAKRLPSADHIICLGSDGQIEHQGHYNEISKSSGYIISMSAHTQGDSDALKEVKKADSITDFGSDQDNRSVLAYIKEESSSTSISSASGDAAAPVEKQDDLSRRTGDVQIYLYYVKSVGVWATLLFVAAIVGFVVCVSFPNVWVQWWAAANDTDPNGRLEYWLGVYAALGVAAIVCLFLSCWQIIVTMVPRSGEKLHFALLETVLNAPMSFFTLTPQGETLNRFSQDLQLIDMELPIAALNTFTTFILCMAQMILIGVGSVYAAVSFPIVLLVLYLVQKGYLRTSRQLRLMDLETKAPLYTLLEETIHGLATIRAFGWTGNLEDKNAALLDRSQRPFYLLFAVQRWLTLVLDLIVAAVAMLLVVLVVRLRGTVTASGIGLALLGVIQFSQHVKLLVTFWANLETHIGSVARIRSFTKTVAPENESDPSEAATLPEAWPAEGGIQFNDISAEYGAHSVLKGIHLSIKPGEKVAVCGRTGSGKTSLIMALFRILDLQGGSITVDGVDLTTIPREEARRRVIGVSQQPFLLKGSVRVNADPLGTSSDDAIANALHRVRLLEMVEANGGLNADIDDLNLSTGQKQLFCFARALLRPGNILVLDEATSSVDTKTEEVIQKLIRTRFTNHTIIAVAHRLDTILDFDRVVVLDAGRVVEVGAPYDLLEKGPKGSEFGRLYASMQGR